MACRRGDERDDIPPAGPRNWVKNKRQPSFQTTQTQPALLRSGGQEPGLPAGGRRKGDIQGVWATCSFLSPRLLQGFPVLFQCLLQAGPASASGDPKLLSAALNLALQPGAQMPETAGLQRGRRAGKWWERNQALYIQDPTVPEG